MIKRKVLIPMAAIMAMSSNLNIFANEVQSDANTEYKEIKYKIANVKTEKGLNVRKTPEIEKDNKLFTAKDGRKFEILGQENDWYKVELDNGKDGWINSQYVDLENESLYVTVPRVNFRAESNLDSKVYKVLAEGTKVEFLEDNNEWIKVKVEDKEGYIHNKYLSNEASILKEKIQKPKNNTEQKSENNEIQRLDKNIEQELPVVNSDKQSSIVNLTYAQLGKPYVWGSEGPNSFDCSGLVNYVYKNGAGINVPRTSKQQSTFGTTISRENLKPGDLIFSSTDGSGGVSHVGIYVGNGQMIHSPKAGDVVKKSNINNSYWNGVYLWAKRVI